MSLTEPAFLDTVDGEIAFFRSITKARPVGLHRHMHVLTMRQSIKEDTGQVVSPDAIWAKLEATWNLAQLENVEDNYYSDDSDRATPGKGSDSHSDALREPSPSENLDLHPHFVSEFMLPYDAEFERLMDERRLKGPGDESSDEDVEMAEAAPPPTTTKGKGKRTRKTSNSVPANILGGDSDSSALTESEDDDMKMNGANSPTEEEEEDEDYGKDSSGMRYFLVCFGLELTCILAAPRKRRQSGVAPAPKKKAAAKPAPKAVKSGTKRKKRYNLCSRTRFTIQTLTCIHLVGSRGTQARLLCSTSICTITTRPLSELFHLLRRNL